MLPINQDTAYSLLIVPEEIHHVANIRTYFIKL